jgi:hypothetical protein
MPKLTTSEREWLAKSHGLLLFERPDKSVIEGPVRFHRIFHDPHRACEIEIEDKYNLRIELPHADRHPHLLETAGRIKSVYDAHPELTASADIHVNADWSLCLAAPQQWTLKYLKDPNLITLFRDYIEPYLYSQSFFQQYNRWPWPNLPHGLEGILTWFHQNTAVPGAARETARAIRRLANNSDRAANMMARAQRHDSFNPRAKCLCGSGRPFIRCHPAMAKLALALRLTA